MMVVAAVVLEARPLAGALEVAGEPKAAGYSSAAWVVGPMDCPAAVAPRVASGPMVCPDRRLPKDVRSNSSPSADDPEVLQAAAPALAFRESAKLEAQTASGTVLWTRVEHRSSPILQ